MKTLTLIILLACGIGRLCAQPRNNGGYPNNNGYGQSNNGYYQNNNAVSRPASNVYDMQIHIVDSTEEITADIVPVKNDPKIKNDRYYFWYYNKVIHSTQGGYTGQLLNGHYIAFYPDKNLKEEGNFKAGLKDGEWKTWNPKGDLTNVTNWSDGIEVQGDQSLWKKIPFINKSNQQGQSKGSGN